MRTTQLLASSLIALASVATGNAFADSYGRSTPASPAVASTVTRAHVQAELARAYQDGSLSLIQDDKKYPVIVNTHPGKTVGQVRAELVKAQKDGSIPKVHG
ncbi:DUF4148 domain-containing protein [Rhodoferax sp.]|uniref:DUF4148 domain-containing protein n=1 Tax=Rhodoferax sp. TaxID=50421 RepID=UPI0025CBC158|nr:DUF4148 domain-containing protein [Rhodoferax sp.]